MASIVIHTGYNDQYPRTHVFSYELNPPKKYALLHIRVRNDYRAEDTRVLKVYYGDSKEELYDRIVKDVINKSDIENEDVEKQALYNYKEIWIDEWVRRRNGDLFRLYKIEDINNETPKHMLKRMVNEIRGRDEENWKLSEFTIYDFEHMNEPLPNKFRVYARGYDVYFQEEGKAEQCISVYNEEY